VIEFNKEKIVDGIASAIFNIRWGNVIFNFGLFGAIIAYVYKFGQEVFELFTNLPHMSEQEVLLNVLGQIDVTMVASLVTIIALGGYVIFVDEHAFDHIKNKPRWMHDINSTTLKIKMGMSLIGVSSIHLLKTFMEISHGATWDQIWKEVLIHLVFCVTTLSYVAIDKLTHPAHPKESH
jgi:uncharacterized protein (TIGR00645 family)